MTYALAGVTGLKLTVLSTVLGGPSHLHLWLGCMLGVFLCLTFTYLKHECWDICSQCD